MISFSAMIFVLAVNRDTYYSAELLLPSFAFAASYAAATVFSVLAIRYGSLAKTALITSCSLLVPSFYGILWLNEPVSLFLIFGMILLVASLVLTNYRKDSEEKRLSWKWVICVFLAFLGNGLCSTVQKAKPLYYGEEGNGLFMTVAFAMVTVIMLVMAFCSRQERSTLGHTFKNGWLLALLCGTANGLTNLLVLYLNARVPASVMFPIISAGSVVLVFLYSVFVNRERFSAKQYVGFILGIISIVLLNL